MRRDFLKLCALAGLGCAAPVGWLRAAAAAAKEPEAYSGPYYVVFNASGGWDTTYLMDPKGVGEINRLYQEGDILAAGKVNYAPNAAHIQSGMSNEEFFARYAPELLVFNGLDYSVNNHSPVLALHGHGQARQPRLPHVRRARRRVQRAGVPAGLPDFRQLLRDRQSRRHVARAVHAVAANASRTPTTSKGTSQSPYHEDFVSDRIEAALKGQTDAHVPTHACRGWNARRACSTRRS